MAINFGIMNMNNYVFGGKSVATLPFYPTFMGIGSMTHRGIEGDDMLQVSPFFISMICGMAFKGAVSKIMGVEGPRMPVAH